MQGKYVIIVLAAALVASVSILGYLSGDQIQRLKEQNKMLVSTVDDLQTRYGEAASSHTTNNTYVKINRVFVASFNSEFQNVDHIKTGETYSITTTFTRLDTNLSTKGSLDYVLVIQVRDEKGIVQDSSWQSGLLPIGKSGSGGIYWTPTKTGSYTVKALVLHSLRGTPLGPSQEISITVTS
jgi:hypothetical protein